MKYTLYPTHRKVGKDNLEIRHSVIFRAVALTRGKKWRYKICYYLEWETNRHSLVFTVTRLCSCATTGRNKQKLASIKWVSQKDRPPSFISRFTSSRMSTWIATWQQWLVFIFEALSSNSDSPKVGMIFTRNTCCVKITP